MAKKRTPDVYILGVMIVGVMIALTFFNLRYIVPPRGNRFDFYPRWRGGQALWNGISPYSASTTDAIQEGMFGGVLPPNVDQQRMVYPAYVGLILAPLLLLPPSTAIAIWLTIQLIAVLATPILWLQILDWKPPPWVLGLLIVGLVLVFRYPINLYIVGQFTGTILFGFSLAVWLLQRKRDLAAGILLALTAIPPTIAIPLALVLVGSFVLIGRPRALIGFVVTLAILTAITFVQIGWWIPDFLTQLGAYSSYALPIWPPGLLEAPILRFGLILAVGLTLLAALIRFRQTRALENFAISAILACLLLLPQTGNYYLILLIPPLLVIFRRGGLIFRLAVALAVISPWFLRVLPNTSSEALLLPLYTLILWLISTYQFQKRPIIEAAQPVHPA